MPQVNLRSIVPQESDSSSLRALHNESQLITQQILIFSMNCFSKTEKLELARVIVPNGMKTHLLGLFQMVPLKTTSTQLLEGWQGRDESVHVNFKYMFSFFERGPMHTFLAIQNCSDTVNTQRSSRAGTTQNVSYCQSDEEKCSPIR